MTDVPPDGILEKVRALLRLASDEAATEHEASLAMERLQAMLLKHNLDMADVGDDGGEPCPVLDEVVDIGQLRWKRLLLNMVALHNFCQLIIDNGRPRIMGRKHNIEVVKEMSSWLAGQLDQLAMTQMGVQEFLGRATNGTWRQSFLYGAINRINERLKELEAEQGQNLNTRALVVDLEAETSAFMYQKYPNLRRGTGVSVDPDAYRAGVTAGNIVSVMPGSRQVEG